MGKGLRNQSGCFQAAVAVIGDHLPLPQFAPWLLAFSSATAGQLAWLVLIVICGSSACQTWFSNKEHVLLSVLQVNLLNTPLSVQSVLPPLNQGNRRKNFKIPLWNAPWLYVCSIVFYSHQIFIFILLLIEFPKCQYFSLVFNSHYERLETPAIQTLSLLSVWFKDHFTLWNEQVGNETLWDPITWTWFHPGIEGGSGGAISQALSEGRPTVSEFKVT